VPPALALQAAELTFDEDGIPFSQAFDDVYHSKDGGLAQVHNVFMAGNGLPARWRGNRRFVICETGFGLGLSFLATWAAWQADPGRSARLHFVSCELHPFSGADLAALYAHLFAADPTLAELGAALIAQWPMLIAGTHRLTFDEGRVTLTLLFGDALQTLPRLQAQVDAFFLDGFSPAKNPTLWQLPLFKQFARLSGPGATLATYTVAGEVRRGLTAAGFVVEKQPGFGQKRQMLTGHFRGARQAWTVPAQQRAIIVGAGMAGASAAERLTLRGWQVMLIDARSGPATQASGNHAGAFRPVVSQDDNLQARLARSAFLYGLRHFKRLPALAWSPCGALQMARNKDEAARFNAIATEHGLPECYLRHVDQTEARRLTGVPVTTGGIWFGQAGWVQPKSLVASLLAAAEPLLTTCYETQVDTLERQGDDWLVRDNTGREIARAPVVVLANAADATRLVPLLGVVEDLRAVTHLPQGAIPTPQALVCGGGYLTPEIDGIHCLGSSAADVADAIAAHTANLALLGQMLDTSPPSAAPPVGRLCARPNTIDRMPVAGPVPDVTRFQAKHAGSLHLAPRLDGLYALTGFGARGLVWCSLLAELLASQIEGEPLPVERDLVQAVDPARFLARELASAETETGGDA